MIINKSINNYLENQFLFFLKNDLKNTYLLYVSIYNNALQKRIFRNY